MEARCREQTDDVRTEENAAIDCVARDHGGKSIKDPAGLRFPGAYESVRIPTALEIMPTAHVRQSRGRLRVGGAGIGRASSIAAGSSLENDSVIVCEQVCNERGWGKRYPRGVTGHTHA